jgi:DNA-directed RNA polymerase subunit RPC12/RpoP
MAVETCPACGFKIKDNHELWNYHVMNTHPSTKACTKCSGTAYYRHHNTNYAQHDSFTLFSYICADCGFVLETWKTVEHFIDKTENIYMPAKHRSKPYFK